MQEWRRRATEPLAWTEQTVTAKAGEDSKTEEAEPPHSGGRTDTAERASGLRMK